MNNDDLKQRVARMVNIKRIIDFKLNGLKSNRLKEDDKSEVIEQLIAYNQVSFDAWLHMIGAFDWDEEAIQNDPNFQATELAGKKFKDDWETVVKEAMKQSIFFDGLKH